MPLVTGSGFAGSVPNTTGVVARLLSLPLTAFESALGGVSVLNVTLPCGDGVCARWERVPDPNMVEFMSLVNLESVCYADCGCGDGYCDRQGHLGQRFGAFPAETSVPLSHRTSLRGL